MYKISVGDTIQTKSGNALLVVLKNDSGIRYVDLSDINLNDDISVRTKYMKKEEVAEKIRIKNMSYGEEEYNL